MNATNSSSTHAFLAGQSVAGGALVGIASGLYMILTHRVAGNSGALKACLMLAPPSEASHFRRPAIGNAAFVFGLLFAGIISGHAIPWAYEPFPEVAEGWPYYIVGGLLTGSGVVLGNGCTSGHGLSGLSKLSLRSLVATPTFMVAASLTAFVKSSFHVGAVAPMLPTPNAHMAAAGVAALAFLLLAVPLALNVRRMRSAQVPKCIPSSGSAGDVCSLDTLAESLDANKNAQVDMNTTAASSSRTSTTPSTPMDHATIHDGLAGLWAGTTFGAGLAIGGMGRPSAVSGALSAARFDFTLWFLFCTALAVTFVFYRIAGACCGITAARVQKQGKIDVKLVLGAMLFGVGWGLTGMCPGPLVLGLGVDLTGGGPQPYSFGPALMLVAVAIGMHGGRGVGKWMDRSIKPKVPKQ